MKEWSDNAKYNPFNSWKALVHSANFEAILEREPKSPIVVNMDLTNKCNYHCRFCMFNGIKRQDQTGARYRFNQEELPKGYALALPKLWKEWGIKASCLAGGGEPTLHPDCLPLIKEYGKQGIELGFVTNGFLVDNTKWAKEIVKNCRFVGFSIDAGNQQDYARTKRVPQSYFGRVIKNLERIAKVKEEMGSDLQIGFKFLLDEMNYTSIYKAAELASRIGVNHFQFRPAINQNHKFFNEKSDIIWSQIETAQKDLERKDFKVMGVRHKFKEDFSRKHSFRKCLATMLTTTWCADGKVYMCTDTRGNPWSYLIDHFPNPEEVVKFWGSQAHWNKVDKINFHKNCDRCTLSAYNEMFEQVFLLDRMDRNLI